jgi:heme/copper-type cytochrome/quinol oxidase subunit 2
MGRTFHLCPRFSFALVLGIVFNVIIAAIAFLGLINAWVDFTISGVRLWSFIISAIIAVIAIILLVYKTNEVRLIHLEGQLPAVEFDIEVSAYWWATAIFIVLTLLLGILHFKYTSSPPASSDFDLSINPGLNARLHIIVGMYLMSSLIWIGIVFFDGIKSQLAEQRRKYAGDKS